MSRFPRSGIDGVITTKNIDGGSGGVGQSDGHAKEPLTLKVAAGRTLPQQPRETTQTLRADLAEVIRHANDCDLQLYDAAVVRFRQQGRRMHERLAAEQRKHPQPTVTHM